MTAALRFDPIRLPPECEKLRKEVRAFLAEEIARALSIRTTRKAATTTFPVSASGSANAAGSA